jgi:hypothetical protein
MKAQDAALKNGAPSSKRAPSKEPSPFEDAPYLSKVPSIQWAGSHECAVADVHEATQSKPHPLLRLSRFLTAVIAGLPPELDDLHWFSDAASRVANGESADTAFGFKPKHGQRSYNAQTAFEERNSILRLLGDVHRGLSKSEKAKRVYNQINRYRTTAWKQDRRNGTCAICHEPLFRVLKYTERNLSIRTLRYILATS